jgi:hypothetical protein
MMEEEEGVNLRHKVQVHTERGWKNTEWGVKGKRRGLA